MTPQFLILPQLKILVLPSPIKLSLTNISKKLQKMEISGHSNSLELFILENHKFGPLLSKHTLDPFLNTVLKFGILPPKSSFFYLKMFKKFLPEMYLGNVIYLKFLTSNV
jgi:uncharacterized protein (DUF1015 family)